MFVSLPHHKTLAHDDALACAESAIAQLIAHPFARDQDFPSAVYQFQAQAPTGTPVVIIGGMGPLAGFDAWKRTLIALPTRSSTLVQYCQIPDRATALREGATSQAVLHVAQALAKAMTYATSKNPTHVFIACNTAHAFLPLALQCMDEQHRNNIRVHSLIDAAVAHAKRLGNTPCVLIAGTWGTRDARLYSESLTRENVAFEELGEDCQHHLTEAIYRGIKAGNRAVARGAGRHAFEAAIASGNITAIIAACTEIPMIVEALSDWEALHALPIIDPIDAVLEMI